MDIKPLLATLSVSKRKFRWLATFYDNDVALNEPRFVKVNPRPYIDFGGIGIHNAYKIDVSVFPAETVTIGFSHECANCPKSNFNRVNLGLYDGVGNLVEEWTLSECQVYSVDSPFGDESGWTDITFTYKHVSYKNHCKIKLGPPQYKVLWELPKNQVIIEEVE